MNAVQTQQSQQQSQQDINYTISDFVTKILDGSASITNPKDPIKYIYWNNFLDQLASHREDFENGVKARFDSIISLAKNEGFDFDAQFFSDSTWTKLVATVVDQQPLTVPQGPQEKLTAYRQSKVNIIDEMLKIEKSIVKKSVDAGDGFEKIVDDIFKSYGINPQTLTNNNVYNTLIKQGKQQAIESYTAYAGNAYPNSILTDKVGFSKQLSFNRTLNNFQGLATEIAKIINASLEKDISALVAKSGVTTRDYFAVEFARRKSGSDSFTIKDIENTFLPGFEAIINKYLINGKVELGSIAIESPDGNPTDLKIKTTIKVYSKKPDLTPSIVSMTVENHIIIKNYEYLIEKIKSQLEQRVNQSTLHVTVKRDWDSKTNIKQALINSANKENVDWSNIFNFLDSFVGKNPSLTYNVTYDEVNEQVKIDFVDTTIKSTDFDYTPASTPPPGQLFIRDRTHDYSAPADGTGILNPTYIKPFIISINFTNMDEIAKDIDKQLKELENSWEDKTPSHPATSIKFGQTPTVPEIENIIPSFSGIMNTIQNPDYTFSLAIKENTEKTESIDIKGEGIASWNSELIKLLKIKPDPTVFDSAFDAFVAAVNAGILNSNSKPEDIKKLLLTIIPETNPYLQTISNALISIIPTIKLSNESDYIMSNLIFNNTSSNTSQNYEFKYVHYLSLQDRHVQYEFNRNIMENVFLDRVRIKYGIDELPRDLVNQLNDLIKTDIDEYLKTIKGMLQIDDDNAKIPDWIMKDIQDEFLKAKDKILHKIETNMPTNLDEKLKDLNKELLNKIKNLPKAMKITLIAIGSALGLNALVSLATPIKTIIASRRSKKINAGKKPRSKGLIITSTILGLLSAGASVAIMLYVFIIQGGFNA